MPLQKETEILASIRDKASRWYCFSPCYNLRCTKKNSALRFHKINFSFTYLSTQGKVDTIITKGSNGIRDLNKCE